MELGYSFFQKQIEDLEESLKVHYQGLDQEIVSLRSECRELTHLNQSLNRENQALNSIKISYEHLVAREKSMRQSIVELEEELTASDESIAELEIEKQKWISDAASTQKEFASYKNEFEGRFQTISDSFFAKEAELEGLKVSHRELQSLLTEAQAKVKNLESEKAALEIEIAQLASKVEQLIASNEAVEKVLDGVRGDVNTLEIEIATRKMDVDKLENYNLELLDLCKYNEKLANVAFDSLQLELQDLVRGRIRDQQIFKSQLDEARAELQALVDQKLKLEFLLSDTIEKGQKNLADLQAKFDFSQAEVLRVQTQNTEAMNQQLQIQFELEKKISEGDEHIFVLKKDVERKHLEIIELSLKLQQAHADNAAKGAEEIQNEAELRQKVRTTERDLQALKKELEDFQHQASVDRSRLSRELESRTQRIGLLNEELESKTRELDFLKSNLEKSVEHGSDYKSMLETELKSCKLEIARLEQHVLESNSRVNKVEREYQQKIQRMEFEFEKANDISTSENSKLVRIVDLQKQKLETRIREVNLLIEEKNLLGAKLESSDQAYKALHGDFSECKNHFETLNADFKKLSADLHRKLNECETLKSQNLDLQKQIEESKQMNYEKLQEMSERFYAGKIRLLEEVQSEKAKSMELKLEVSALRKKEEMALSEYETVYRKYKDLEDHSLLMNEQIHKETKVNADLFTEVKGLREALEKCQKDFQEAKRSQEDREQQIFQYRQFVNQERGQYQKAIAQLAKDIQVATTIHPLKDYLVATERELSRVESDLKKTPASSTNRGSLEGMIDQLIAQRDLLRGLILKAQENLSLQVQALEEISKGPVSMQAPPLPPRSPVV